jgi:hypothetical protein
MTASVAVPHSRKMLVLRLYMTVFVCAAILLAGHARAEAQSNCKSPTVEEVVQLLNSWKAELSKGSSDSVLAFYAEDATLVATKSGAPLKGKQAIRSYYDDLLNRHPEALIKSTTMVPGCNSAVVNGTVLYRVTGARKGTRTLLGGSYTMELELRNASWQIVRQSLAADPRGSGAGAKSL